MPWVAGIVSCVAVYLLLFFYRAPLFILNDDVAIESILSGAYTGTPDMHTVYMGAGLSFSNAVERICTDYEKDVKEGKRRYAFEQMRLMNHCLHMGLGPGEVCMEWGNHFQEKEYGRFAMLLTQSFTKGAREIRSMMEKEQQEAFQVQIDYVRREGEEASTRLLFPMIVLLFLTMILVMFPAFMQFYAV